MFKNIELSIYDKNDEMDTIGSSSDEIVLSLRQFSNLASLKTNEVLEKLSIKDKSELAIGVWSKDADGDNLKSHFHRYNMPRQRLLNWSELFRLFPETRKVDWDNVLQTFHKKRNRFIPWVNSVKLFIIRNDYPEDREFLKPYIDDYTVVLTWKDLLQKLNTDLDLKFERHISSIPSNWDSGMDFKWDNHTRHLVFPDNIDTCNRTYEYLSQDEDTVVQSWSSFLSFYHEAAEINWEELI